jgi:hypothetical protein
VRYQRENTVIGLACQDVNIVQLVPGGICHTLREHSVGSVTSAFLSPKLNGYGEDDKINSKEK